MPDDFPIRAALDRMAIRIERIKVCKIDGTYSVQECADMREDAILEALTAITKPANN